MQVWLQNFFGFMKRDILKNFLVENLVCNTCIPYVASRWEIQYNELIKISKTVIHQGWTFTIKKFSLTQVSQFQILDPSNR